MRLDTAIRNLSILQSKVLQGCELENDHFRIHVMNAQAVEVALIILTREAASRIEHCQSLHVQIDNHELIALEKRRIYLNRQQKESL
jgi:hypothetical protein